MNNKTICPKCGNDKFYTYCSIPAKIEWNPDECEYGEIYDIDEGQTDNLFEVVYCSKCNEEIDD